MKESGGPVIMVLGLFSLLWLFSENPAKVEPIPVDGLIEVMQRASETLEIQHGHETDFANIDHIADANKKVDPQPSPSDKHEKAKREIIIFTRPNCPPCDQWKRCEQAKFEADGWVVAYCDQHNFGLTPHFSIEKNGKTYDHKGYLPFGKIDEVTR
ncbi:MAG: hypothetical protein ACOVLE_04275 [Pirellula staleyi]